MDAAQPGDRRRFGRIHLIPPLPGRLGDARVDIADISMTGASVTAFARFAPASTADFTFKWEGADVRAVSRVIRCTLAQFARAPGEKSTYQTGLQIVETVGESDRVIREIIAVHVMRALEEQKANALGLPPIAPLIEPHQSQRFRKCELIDNRWRRIETSTAEQPADGFTVSVDVPLKYVTLLCETYQRADDEGRRLTRTLAQLSVTKGEGLPARRYIP